jgi:hypothetical protein
VSYRVPGGEPTYLIGLIILMAAFALAASGCSSVRPRAPLVQQIIRMRPGHKALTHQICGERNWLGKCQRMDVVEYDLNDAGLRQKLVSLGFRCRIAGWRYKIDPDRPSFIRYQRVKEPGFFGKEKTVKVNRVDFSQTQLLIDSATECYSEQFYRDGLASH